MFRSYALIMAFAMVLPCVAHAAGISLGPGEIKIENLPAGQSYNLGELAGIEWTAQNKNNATSTITFSSVAPTTVPPGFAPVPDTSWLEPDKGEIPKVGPWKKVSTSLVLSIPAEEKYLGKAYCATLEAKASPPASAVNIGVAANARILFSVSAEMPEESAEPDQSPASDARSISTSPYVLDAGSVRAGAVFRATDPVEISNPGDEDIMVRLEQVSLDDSKLRNIQDSESLPDGSFLVIEHRTIRVPAGGKTKVPVYIAVPDNGEYSGRRFAVVLNATVVKSGVSVGTYTVVKFEVE